jgi:hypothetical protein
MGNSIPIDGTIARFTCAPFYEKDSVEQRPCVCLDGTWSQPAPKCVPGQSNKKKMHRSLKSIF